MKIENSKTVQQHDWDGGFPKDILNTPKIILKNQEQMTTLIWKIRSFCEKLGKFFRKTKTRKIRSSGSLALGNSINECKEDRFSYLDITLNYIHFTHLLEYMQDFFYKFGLWSAWIWKKMTMPALMGIHNQEVNYWIVVWVLSKENQCKQYYLGIPHKQSLHESSTKRKFFKKLLGMFE